MSPTADDDGYISVDDAYAYAFDAMRVSGAQQTPQRWLYGAEGDIVLAKNPTATGLGAMPPRHPDLKSARSAPRPTTTVQSPAGVGRRPPGWFKGSRRTFLVAAMILTVVVAAGLASGIAVWQAGHGGNNGDSGGVEFSFREGRHVETSVPWHLTISTGPQAPHDGCTVQVREKTKSGSVVASTPHPSGQDNVILQVKDTGTLYLDYPQGCLVDAEKGRGDAAYPVTIPAGVGDSLAWNPSGPMEITANADSSFPCYVNMVNAETGGIAQVTIDRPGQAERYDPPATSSMYMSVQGTNCAIRAQDASTTGP